MKIQAYKQIFTKIEKTLHKESSLSQHDFDLEAQKFINLSYKNYSDEDIFWMIVGIVFYSGMRAKTVSEKLPALGKYLKDFRKVKDYSQEEINQILEDPNIIRYRRKIESCVANAKAFNTLLKEYGSFNSYLESFGPLTNETGIDNLRRDLRNRFDYLGRRTVNHFLMELGLNVLKPDRVICRIFSRLGLIDHEDAIVEAIEVGKNIANVTGYPIRYIDIIFVKYGQMDGDGKFGLKGGICVEKNPKCHVCGITEYCDYYSNKWL
jgi:DNA-3-methyladenine glycosylase I